MTETSPSHWRILNAEPLGYCDKARVILAQVGAVVERPLTWKELLTQIGEFDVLIVRLGLQVDRDVMEAGQRLKIIVTATTGLDHIDVECARSRGIAVLSLRDETGFLRTVSATAEHTWALLLALLRYIPLAFASVRAGVWDRDAFRGHELDSKRLGLVGLGRIGRKVARYGLAFDMSVAAYDPYTDEWVGEVKQLPDLASLLCCSDVFSLHVPLNEQTTGMIGANELALLPEGAVLVNTSRGDLVEEAALAAALRSEHLAGAALDVMAHEREERQWAQSPLLAYAREHDNLLITPHIGGATVESMAKTETFMARKLLAFSHNLQTADNTAKSSARRVTL